MTGDHRKALPFKCDASGVFLHGRTHVNDFFLYTLFLWWRLWLLLVLASARACEGCWSGCEKASIDLRDFCGQSVWVLWSFWNFDAKFFLIDFLESLWKRQWSGFPAQVYDTTCRIFVGESNYPSPLLRPLLPLEFRLQKKQLPYHLQDVLFMLYGSKKELREPI